MYSTSIHIIRATNFCLRFLCTSFCRISFPWTINPLKHKHYYSNLLEQCVTEIMFKVVYNSISTLLWYHHSYHRGIYPPHCLFHWCLPLPSLWEAHLVPPAFGTGTSQSTPCCHCSLLSCTSRAIKRVQCRIWNEKYTSKWGKEIIWYGIERKIVTRKWKKCF